MEVDRWRHAPLARSKAAAPFDHGRATPQAYKGGARRSLKDIYDSDHAESHKGGRFRWVLSTILAGTVGAIAFFVVIFGSLDPKENAEGFIPSLSRIRETRLPSVVQVSRNVEGLKWSAPKSDRLQTMSGAVSTRFIIHETLKQRRNGREYIHAKPYVRIVGRLAPVPSTYADVIPPFNPYRLYANSQPLNPGEADEDGAEDGSDVAVKVVELLGGILPGEDGQELDAQEVGEIVERAQASDADTALMRPAIQPEGHTPQGGLEQAARAEPEPVPPFTTVLPKSTADGDQGTTDLERREVSIVKVAKGDTLVKILTRAGADTWSARAMADAAKAAFPDSALQQGQEVHITLVPSLTKPDRSEPASFSVFEVGHQHKVTVMRNAAGEFVASATPFDESAMALAAMRDDDQPQSSSLYSSIYHAGLLQNVSPETILQILRIHVYDMDYRRRLRNGDSVEFFFDLKEEGSVDAAPGELLFTAIAAGGETSRFYRFRTPDGLVDYYDEQGNNSKKFLMRRPVRGNDLRLTSGFGYRFHPLLNERKMHTGVDWAAPTGTPILAAGNGVIEEAGRKGQYGNYIRIRHANGYQTTYAHMSRLAQGADVGAKVRQGQVVGFVGSTGLSSGPHLHYEVLVNNRFVDPLSIQVPRERQLTGKQLADFQKERARIDELMRRAPVITSSK